MVHVKLRIHKNSFRFRFTRDEVKTLASCGTLEETVAVGPLDSQRLSYRIVPENGTAEPPGIRAELEVNKLTISVPHQILQAWHEGEQLAVEGEQTWPGGTIRLFLEKDMQRLNPKEGEDSTGAYPNPLFGKARCEHP